jgi:DinB superfamily
MKNIRSIFAPLLLLTLGTAALSQTNQPPERLTSAQVIEYWVTVEEQRLVAVADAMPADKYPFAPSSGEFKGVRTFAEQLKHTAADNYMLGAAILGEKPPANTGDETGPDSLRSKADVIQYLKDSFAYLHKAVTEIDDMNAVIETPPISPMPKGRATRLGLAVEVLMHTFNHYGQMVEYLRMNGIVPPASRLD